MRSKKNSIRIFRINKQRLPSVLGPRGAIRERARINATHYLYIRHLCARFLQKTTFRRNHPCQRPKESQDRMN